MLLIRSVELDILLTPQSTPAGNVILASLPLASVRVSMRASVKRCLQLNYRVGEVTRIVASVSIDWVQGCVVHVCLRFPI